MKRILRLGLSLIFFSGIGCQSSQSLKYPPSLPLQALDTNKDISPEGEEYSQKPKLIHTGSFTSPLHESEETYISEPSSSPSLGNMPLSKIGFSDNTGSGTNNPEFNNGDTSPNQTPLFYISDVILEETNLSVKFPNPKSSLRAKYSENHIIFISIKGNFKSKIPINEDNMKFTFKNGLLHQTFLGEFPKIRVILDDVLILEPIEISSTQIKLKFNTHLIPDLRMVGKHKLKLYSGSETDEVMISITEPIDQVSVIPQIKDVEVHDFDNLPSRKLIIRGVNFFLNSSWAKLTVNNIDVPSGIINIFENGVFEIHTILPESQHEFNLFNIRYENPFGISLKEVNVL